MNVISAYAPQVGFEMEVKEAFGSDINEIVHGFLLKKEFSYWSKYFNAHVGEN